MPQRVPPLPNKYRNDNRITSYLQEKTKGDPIGSGYNAIKYVWNNYLKQAMANSMAGDMLRHSGIDMPPKQPVTMEGLAMEGAFASPGLMGGQIKAYHGSPHRFKKFTTDKMGTGEGGQAFGWGAYFTDKKGIAKAYAKTDKAFKIDGKPAREWYESHPLRGVNNPMKAASHLNTDIETAAKWMDESQELLELQAVDAISTYGNNAGYMLGKSGRGKVLTKLDEMKRAGRIKEDAHVYKATLHKGKTPDQYDYLDWYDWIPEKTKNKINAQAKKEFGDTPAWKVDMEGGNFYRYLARFVAHQQNKKAGMEIFRPSDKEASLFLKRAGIDGMRYPTETLSGKGTKGRTKHNYVVYDDADITIDEIL